MTGEVPPPGHDDDVASSDHLRASHQDRDRVAEALRIAAGDGRLTAEELDERLEKALTARTHGELKALSKDLSAAPGLLVDPAAAKPKDVIRIYRTSGWAKKEGRWLVPQRIEVRVGSGHVKLDFTDAVITQPLLRIDARVGSGGLKLLTRRHCGRHRRRSRAQRQGQGLGAVGSRGARHPAHRGIGQGR